MRLEAFRDVFGGEVAALHDPVRVEGLEIEATLRPRDGDELSRVLARLCEEKEPVLVRGGGSRMGTGNPPRDARVLLSTERIAGIEELDREDGVVRVRAGTPIAELAKAAGEAGWELPFDAPGAAATVGGVIASGASGPRRQRFGAPANHVLGLDVVLATGERTSCGARVVKNVTGYDMAKLYAGSFGCLGVIEAAWLRVRPRPALVKTAVAAFEGADREAPARIGLAAARRDTARAVALLAGEPATQLGGPSGAATVLVVEYGGDEPAVLRDLAWLHAQAAVREVPEEARVVGRLRDLQATGEVRARIAVLPTELPRVLAPLARAGLGTIAYPGLGIVYAIARDAGASLAAIDEAAAGADRVFEALPLELRRERDVFGEPGATSKIARALKQQFDPAGILNPGRFQGRL